MVTMAIIESYFLASVALSVSLILLSHLIVNVSMKLSDKRWRKTRESRKLVVRIVEGSSNEWCSLYIGKELVVKPSFNRYGNPVDFLYTVIPCRENKRILSEAEYLSSLNPNPWGMTLSVSVKNVEVLP